MKILSGYSFESSGFSVMMYNHRSNHISLLSGYPEPAATQIRTATRGLRPARDGYKITVKNTLTKLVVNERYKSEKLSLSSEC